MKNVLLIISAFICYQTSFGQRIRFSDTTNQWDFRILTCCSGATFTPDESYESESYIGGVIVSGVRYSMLLDQFIREDTVLNKVYVRYWNSCTSTRDSFEQVLYDYNWHLGDTVRQHNYCGDSALCWVSAMDSTQINGRWYKIWQFQGTFDGGSSVVLKYNVIEGIGCTNGLTFPIRPYPEFENSEQMFCFSTQGATHPLSNPVSSWGLLGDIYLDDSLSCNFPLKVNTATAQSDLTIFPNPVASELTINFAVSMSVVDVMDCLGKTIARYTPNATHTQINVGYLPKGMYLLRINGSDVRKFVKE